MSEPTIRTVAVSELVPDAANVRRRDERAKATIENSIVQFGPARSIVIDGKQIVRAGNGTLEGFAAAGGTEVLIVKPGPNQLVAVERDDWSATEATAYAIADNRTAELATWDDIGLATQLRSLESSDFALDAIGFTPLDVDVLCASIGDDALDHDSAEPPVEFVEKDESIETSYQCPKCGYRWSGKVD